MDSIKITLPNSKKEVKIEIQRKRMKTVRLKVFPEQRVVISVPKDVHDEWVLTYLKEKSNWIESKLAVFIKTKGYESIKSIKSGMSTKILGRDVKIIISQNEKSFSYREGDIIHIGIKDINNQDVIGRNFEKWWREKAQNTYKEYIDKLYPIVGKYNINKPVLYIKKMKTLWGSCSTGKEKITINYYLLKALPSCIEYVILHELVHLIYPRHNKEFYNFLSIHMPDWKERKRKLDHEVVLSM